MPPLIIPFAAASILLFFTPGPAMTLILATGAARGIGAGLRTVLGNAIGCAVLLAIVFAGLEVIVSHFAAWFPFVRYAGAAYLFWLGVRFWMRDDAKEALVTGDARYHQTGQFFSGMVVAFANPAQLAFLAAFLPQFIDPARNRMVQFFWLSMIFLAACMLVQTFLAFLADRASKWFIAGHTALINRIAAVVMMLGALVLIFAKH